MTTIIAATFAAFVTSAFTALAGMGGGVLLLSILPSILPAPTIIPIHGIVQLTSNASRFFIGIKDAVLQPILHFSIGAIAGSFLGFLGLGYLNTDYIPLIISAFILCILWLPIDKITKYIPGKYYSLGIIQTGISVFTGAVGPLSTTILVKDGYNSSQVISTNAGINAFQNILKSIVFISSGFFFKDHLSTIIFMCIASIAGSFFGISLRKYVQEKTMRSFMKFIITLLCSINIIKYLYQ